MDFCPFCPLLSCPFYFVFGAVHDSCPVVASTVDIPVPTERGTSSKPLLSLPQNNSMSPNHKKWLLYEPVCSILLSDRFVNMNLCKSGTEWSRFKSVKNSECLNWPNTYSIQLEGEETCCNSEERSPGACTIHWTNTEVCNPTSIHDNLWQGLERSGYWGWHLPQTPLLGDRKH